MPRPLLSLANQITLSRLLLQIHKHCRSRYHHLKKPTDLDLHCFTNLMTNSHDKQCRSRSDGLFRNLHCLQRQGISGFSRTRIKVQLTLYFDRHEDARPASFWPMSLLSLGLLASPLARSCHCRCVYNILSKYSNLSKSPGCFHGLATALSWSVKIRIWQAIWPDCVCISLCAKNYQSIPKVSRVLGIFAYCHILTSAKEKWHLAVSFSGSCQY